MNLLSFLSLLTVLACHAIAYSLDGNYHNLFSADIYRGVIKSEKGNFAVSPLSAQIVLALVHAGAEGKTAQELASALRLPQEKENIQEIFKKLLPYLQGNEHYSLSSANKIYLKRGYKVWDSYKKTAEDVFGAEIQNIRFKNKKKAVMSINKWVEAKTNHKIQDLLSVDDITNRIRSVLISAMYFEAKWSREFNKDMTSKHIFHLNNSDTVDIDMMQEECHYNYYESRDLDAKFLEMPYVGGEATMTFVLPNEKEGLNDLEKNMKKVIEAIQYEYRKVHVEIPKFTIESKINFNAILQDLGVHEAFADSAKFNQIVVDEPLKIGKVAQKTFLEVTEAGTTAAAATYAVMLESRSFESGDPGMAWFVADHPFLYYIKVKDVILFIGRYVSP